MYITQEIENVHTLIAGDPEVCTLAAGAATVFISHSHACQFSELLDAIEGTTYYLLLTTYYLPLTTYYLQCTTYNLLLTTYYLLLTTYYLLRAC